MGGVRVEEEKRTGLVKEEKVGQEEEKVEGKKRKMGGVEGRVAAGGCKEGVEAGEEGG